MNDNTPLLVVTGPTASGKTRLAVALANELKGEIISADSRQVYRDMTLGTGKDLAEYGNVPYHLIDICDAGSKYNLFNFIRDARMAIDNIRANNCQPIVCGGTGLYVETLLKGIELPEVPRNDALRAELAGKSLDELIPMLASMKELHNTTDIDTVQRAIRAIEIRAYYNEHPDQEQLTHPDKPIPSVILCTDIDRETRRERITKRLNERIEAGMIQEVQSLLDRGISPDDLIYYGLEYKFITLHCIGQLTYKEMFDQLNIAIHQFAKRQMTWFRGMERRGFKLHHIPYDIPTDELITTARALLNNVLS